MTTTTTTTDIAIIGLACRVPGAHNYDQFWRNLRDGVESIAHFREDELELTGSAAQPGSEGAHPAHPAEHAASAPGGAPAYVRARSILDDVDLFDAAFFGIYPNEARVMDPQHRVFLECCWQAIEDAGYDPTTDPSTTGVFAGCSPNSYFLRQVNQGQDYLKDYTEAYQVGFYTTMLGTIADTLATRVSYKLNLTGPSLTIQSACSTSLVAVCQAVKSLLTYECDLALAGGVSITFPQKRGYAYQPGGMVSPDGHCRPFDADAQGTVFGHGAGVVVLKRLDEALADGDHIHGVIKGTALNNDGALKVGFTAPSVDGQARVIAMAQAAAGIDPASISYVEAHGTATPLGDPIEFAALSQAFGSPSRQGAFCALGTAKANIGHLDAAAGVIGLIKTVLSMTHRQIPPLLHFRRPNPHIDLENSPFYIATELKDWVSLEAAQPGNPLRAGVSAFGVGGTNAHVVLEEAPASASGPSRRTAQLFTVSAKSASALESAKEHLAACLEEHSEEHSEQYLADVAYTLSIGRHSFEHRWSAACRDVPEAIQALREPAPATRSSFTQLGHAPNIAFLFPGQGAQHVSMGRDLFETEPVFRAHMARCAEILRPHLGLDILQVIYPDASDVTAATTQLNATILAQPAIFAVTYAMTQLWASWGIRPQAMLGHSIGEFVAACLAGVFSLEDALQLVAARGRMMNELPRGAMLSVRLSESDMLPYLDNRNRLSLAASNGPALSVAAGDDEAIGELERELSDRGVPTRRLHTSHAFHSSMMEPIIGAFAERVGALQLHPPRIPFLSCVSGDWITDEQATDRCYWASHLRQPVRFSRAIQVLRGTPGLALVEVGPGTTLQTLARQHPAPHDSAQVVVSSMAEVRANGDATNGAISGATNGDAAAAYRALGRLWSAGVAPDWTAFYAHEHRRRVPLSTYPFERKRYWAEPAGDMPLTQAMDVDPNLNPNLTATMPAGADGDVQTRKRDTNEEQQEDRVMPTTEATGSAGSAGSAPSEPETPLDRMSQLMMKLVEIFRDLSGLEAHEIGCTAGFLELGFDSLFLTQVAQALQTEFDVKVTFRQLLAELPSIGALATYLDQQLPLPPSMYQEAVRSEPASAPLPATLPAAPSAESLRAPIIAPVIAPTIVSPDTSSVPLTRPLVAAASPHEGALDQIVSETALERLMRDQLQTMSHLMAQQLQALREASMAQAQPVEASGSEGADPADPAYPAASPRIGAEQIPVGSDASATTELPKVKPVLAKEEPAPLLPHSAVNAANAARQAVPHEAEFKPFGPYKPIQKGARGGLTSRQDAFIGALIERYTSKTRQSKQLTQEARPYLADPRAAAGFRIQWKEMVYPIVANRSKGARLWDVDGNEYIDILCGYGPIGLGHRPDAVTKAIHKQLDEGIEIGPQTPLAGEVAKLLCKMTGVERVTFCNTGSEAVMAALRVARTVTGRKKFVLFAGSYHGTFDEVLVRRVGTMESPRTSPIAPGIPSDNVQHAIVLDYGTPESLQWLRAHAHELAAVLVEPVQSRHPGLQPREFLHELRNITATSGSALVIDEIVTGFRVHPGGIQALFDVQADLVTYGKVLGGGMPIGVLAGKASFMDALDGGMWQFGDDSYPEVGVTFFAGTFVRHPLALAAAKAVLEYLDEHGPALQEETARRTATLVNRLNTLFERYKVPTRIEAFGSVFYFGFPSDYPFGSLLYYLLREKGIHIQEGFPCFISTVHTAEDLDHVYNAFAESVAEMREGELLPPGDAADDDISDGLVDTSGARTAGQSPATAMLSSAVEGRVRNDTSDTPSEAPLTESQLEIWLAAQRGADASCAFNEAFTLSLSGGLDEAALRDAIKAVIARHDALRATFDPGGKTVRFAPRLDIQIPMLDLSSSNKDEPNKDEEIKCIIRADARTPFDLVQGPLVRVKLMRLAPRQHIVLFTSHHIICDGWSTNVILEELATLYSAYSTARNGQATELELPPAASFRAYADTQRQDVGSAQSAAIEQYWLAQFAEEAPALDLPTDRPRPAVKSLRGATARHHIGPDLSQALKRTGARQGCTLFATLAAGFEVLLCRLSGQQDLVVGIPAAGQSLLADQSLVGHCVNFLALRGRLSDDATFAQCLQETQATLLDAYEHQAYTYGTLVRRLGIRRDPSRQPLIEVQFNLEKIGAAAHFDGLEVTIDSCPKEFVTFDLFLNVVESAAGLVIDCDYNADLFEADTIARWLGHYETLLASVAADVSQRVSRIPLLTEAQRRDVIARRNETEADYPCDRCVHQLFEEQAARTPNDIAVVFENRSLTYAELDRGADQVAHRLRASGVSTNHLVALYLERSLDMVVAMLGVLKTGAAYIPLDPANPKNRTEVILGEARPSVVLSQKRLVKSLDGGGVEACILCLDADELVRSHSQASIGGPNRRNHDQQSHSTDLAYVIYTSGSTGKPKGVEISHRAVVNFLSSMQREPGLSAADRLLAVTTLSFDIAGLELLLPLMCGARVVIASREDVIDGVRLSRIIRAAGITVMQATPSTWRLLLEAGWMPGPSLKVLCGGEAFPRDLANQLLAGAGEVWNMYGPTETTIWSAVSPVQLGDDPVLIGPPIANTRFYVLDRNQQPVAPGVLGELHIGGDGLARGYFDRPDLTAERFVPDPFSSTPGARLYRTGDVVRARANGMLEFLGRVDRQVKMRGFRIELEEIESVLGQHPSVQEATVLAREDVPGHKRLVAYVVRGNAQRQRAVTTSELQRFLETRLPGYMIPSAFVYLDALPQTPNGKVDRRALAAPSELRPAASSDFVAPEVTVHHQLRQLWEEVLEVRPIGIRDDFFALGGHSLLAARLIDRIAQVCGVRLPLATLFERATIEHLSEVLLAAAGAGTAGAAGAVGAVGPPAALVALQTGGTRPPLIFLHGDFEGGGFYCAALARHLGPEQPVYVLQPHGLDGSAVPPSFEEMARAYVEVVEEAVPRGPYMLGGFCAGGVVAFELARQLSARGRPAEMVVLVNAASDHRRARLGRRVIDRAGALLGRPVEARVQTFLQLRDMDTGVVAALRGQAGMARPRQRQGTRPWRDEVLGRYTWASTGYRPRRYEGRVALVWSEQDDDASRRQATRRWRQAVPGLEVVHTPGTHLTAITTHVARLAELLGEKLGRRDARDERLSVSA